MWLFTSNGFFSVVERGPDGYLCVLSRDERDLMNLQDYLGEQFHKEIPIEQTNSMELEPYGYSFRMLVEKKDFEKYLIQQVREVKYDNFTNYCQSEESAVAHRKSPSYFEGLSRIWKLVYEFCGSNKRDQIGFYEGEEPF